MNATAIRVFVSSTFLDLDAEREVLLKDVFPRIRKLCAERGAAFSGIDLRTGIPPGREVLRTCLAEIDRCRPYFLAVLGDRYGTIVHVPPETLDEYPWLARYPRASITEIEIRHGVLNDPDRATQARFYIREGSSDDAQRALRKEIGNAPRLRTRTYADLETFRETVFDDLKSIVDTVYPPAPADTREREARNHRAFANEQTSFSFGRGLDMQNLDAALSSGAARIAVVGPPGIGKSALLASWARRYARRHPRECVLTHFVRASAHGANVSAMLARILTELMFRSDVRGEIPEQPTASDLGWWLHETAALRPVIVIDGIESLHVLEARSPLHWLPAEVPQGARLIVSSTSGPHADALARAGWHMHALKPLRPKAIAKTIRSVMRHHGKELAPEPFARIVATPAAATPRFLSTLLEEVRLAPNAEALGEALDRGLAASDTVELFCSALRRYERDFDRTHPGLVRAAMGALWAARDGLFEHELIRLVGSGSEPIPQAAWSPLFLAMEHALSYRSGRLALTSEEHREAVRRMYVATPFEEFQHRHRLVWFIKNFGDAGLNVRELHHQLEKLRDWDNLIAVLGRPGAFESFWSSDSWEVRRLWKSIEVETGVSAAQIYVGAVNDPDSFGTPTTVWYLATLLTDLGHTAEALRLRSWLVEHYRASHDAPNEVASRNHVAALLRRLGRHRDALAILTENETLSRATGDWGRLFEAAVNKAGVQAELGMLEDALATYGEVDFEIRAHPNAHQEQIFRNGLGLLQLMRKEHDAALRSFERAALLAHDAGDLATYQAAIGNIAIVHIESGDFAEALKRLDEQQAICRRIGHGEGLVGELGNRGVTLLRLGHTGEAIDLHREELKVAGEIGFLFGHKQGLGHLAQALAAAGELAEAVQRWLELAELCKSDDDTKGQRIGFHNAAGALQRIGREAKARGDHAGACDALRWMVQCALEAGEEDTLAAARRDLVLALQDAAIVAIDELRYADALRLFHEQERVSVEAGDSASWRRSMHNQRVVATQWGETSFDGADLATRVLIARELERIFRSSGDDEGADRSLVALATLLQHVMAEHSDAGRFDDALAAAREAADIYTHLGDHERLQRMNAHEQYIIHLLGKKANYDGAP